MLAPGARPPMRTNPNGTQWVQKLSDFTFKIFAHLLIHITYQFIYHEVASSITSRLEAHAGFFRLLMKEIYDPYVQ